MARGPCWEKAIMPRLKCLRMPFFCARWNFFKALELVVSLLALCLATSGRPALDLIWSQAEGTRQEWSQGCQVGPWPLQMLQLFPGWEGLASPQTLCCLLYCRHFS